MPNRVRLSPSCSGNVFEYGGPSDNLSVSPHTSGCYSGGAFDEGNTGFLGSSPSTTSATLFIDYFENPFSLLSLDTQGWDVGTTVLSSKGAVFAVPNPDEYLGFTDAFLNITFSGPDWTGVQWIEINVPTCPGACRRVDNITFDVPEPSPAALLTPALGALLLTRRRSVRHQAISVAPRQ